jgi:cytochrome c-type biogenesis protein CcmH
MTLFVTLIAVSALAVAAFLYLPFLRHRDRDVDPNREMAIYEDQLAEVERDRDRGVLTDDQAAAARLEIERRLLKAGRQKASMTSTRSRAGRFATTLAIAAVPFMAGGIYLGLGSPDQPASPFAERQQAEAAPSTLTPGMAAGTHPEMEDRIAALEERLANAPDDVEGQALLARSYAAVGNYDAALRRYEIANRLTEGRERRLAGEYAEILVLTNDGMVPDTAAEIFRLILTDFPNDPQATYYTALWTAQNGDVQAAAARLRDLLADAPQGAPWAPAVSGLLAELDPQAEGAPRRGPTPTDMAAAAEMSEADRQAMIAGMVASLEARLEDTPDDLAGWRQMARAYEVLGRTDDAVRAYGEVLRLAPNDPAARARRDALLAQ